MNLVIRSFSRPMGLRALGLHGVAAAALLTVAAFPAPAQNTLGYPSGHQLVTLQGGGGLGGFRSTEGVALTNGSRGMELTLVPGRTSGRAEYRMNLPRGTREIIPSWSGRTPGGSGFRVLMNLPQSGGWFEAGSWGSVGPIPETRKIVWPDGSVYMYDHAKLASPATEVGIGIELVRPSPDAPSPSVWLVSLSCAPETKMARPLLSSGKHGAVTGRPVDSQVPFIPQAAVGRKDWVDRTCSPAVMCMMLARHGIQKSVLDMSTQTFDRPSDAFGVWNRAVMSGAEQGFDGYVTRLRNWGEVHSALASGAMVGASIRMKPGEVRDPLTQFGRRLEGTKGHIILIRAINADGTVVTNDPASKDHGGGLTWNPADLGRAWFEKGGVAYILKK
jgi:hypothetical protein